MLKNFPVNYKKYDIIIDYRADNSYFSFTKDFINSNISYRQLKNVMLLRDLGQQLVLKSKRAFNCIHFLGNKIAKHDEWYPKKMLRDKIARRMYFDVERNKRKRGDLYITNIIDEEIKANDPCLR